MKFKNSNKKALSEAEIDERVIEMANDQDAWEQTIHVHRSEATTLSMPANLIMRAAFLARLHRKSSVEEWLANIIRERVEIEEAAFSGAKHDLSSKINRNI